MAGVTWRRNEMQAPSDPEAVEQYDWDAVAAAENLTPYGGWLHPGLPAPGSALDFPGFLVETDPLHFTGKPRDVESLNAITLGAQNYQIVDAWIHTP